MCIQLALACRLTFRVAEPEVLGATFAQANGVTRRGLGGRSEATGAGNPVLADDARRVIVADTDFIRVTVE